jgi:hypothetical protein
VIKERINFLGNEVDVVIDPSLPPDCVRVTYHPEQRMHPDDIVCNTRTGEITKAGELRVVRGPSKGKR